MTQNGTKPVIKFKTIRVKHQLEMYELAAKLETGEATTADDTNFLMSMIVSWDFKDVDTGAAIPSGQYQELSRVQFAELQAAWFEHRDATDEEVKKTRNGTDADSSSS